MRHIALVLAMIAIVTVSARPARADDDAPQVTKPPKLAHFVPAERPAGTEDKTAVVVLSIEIAADGKVSDVRLAQTGGADFDAAAIAAVKQFIFEPAEVDGQPAPVTITYSYKFTVEEKIVSLGPQVNFEGIVVERFKKTPLAGVKILIKDVGLEALTDAQGQFAFTDLPIGVHQVELSGPGLISVTTEEDIGAKQKRTVKYYAELKQEGVDEEEVIHATRIKKETASVSIRTEEARKVPGTQGDTLKVVQNLPGVGRSSFGSGQLIVWGSAPNETRVFVDGVEIPALYHGGGLRSTVNSDLIKSIDLLPGAFGAEYGRGIGGLVKSETRTLPREGTHGYAAVDVIDASAFVTTALSKRARIGIAGRRSHLDSVLSRVTSQDVGDFVPIPQYYDGQVLAQIDLGKDETLELGALGSDDRLTRTIGADDPAQIRRQQTHDRYYRGFARYQRILGDGSSFVLVPSIGWDGNTTNASFGSVPTSLDVASWKYAVRGSYRRKIDPHVTLSLGVDAQGQHTKVSRFGSVTLPPREGDITVFGQPPGDEVNADSWTTSIVSVAPYGFAEIAVGKLAITPGLRVEPYLIDGSRLTPIVGSTPALGYRRMDVALEPRVSGTYKLTKQLQLRAGAGIYHQAPDPTDLSAVFGNPTLGLIRAYHGSAGISYKLTGTLTAEVVGFAKKIDGLASRSELPTPPLARTLVQDGVGRVFGGQALLRQELTHGLFGWITYSLIRSERKDHPSSDWRLFDYDQTHVLSVLASYDLGRGWQLGARFRYATGVPRTEVMGSYYDARDDRFEPLYGAHNAIRVPAFYQLDARVERTMTIAAHRANLFLDVQNLTNRKNPEEIIYNFNYTTRQYITGLPTLAVVGVRVEL
ncbi:MAG: TonB family protein / TonB-dependent receptor [Myxococcales bacterium]|nr:TonB family protein / TonB-dependent receptor [Myxococcales bacterium]